MTAGESTSSTSGDDALSVEIEIIGDSVVGQVAPPDRVRITAEVPEQEAFQVDADDLGCFSLTTAARGALARGPLRLQIDRDRAATSTGSPRTSPTPRPREQEPR